MLAKTLTGNSADNVITGGSDNDTLSGDLGNDTLNGGAGAGTFVYQTIDESRLGAWDKILDFTTGQDKIDWARVGRNNEFTFFSANCVSLTRRRKRPNPAT